jgi:hypothetical protein
MKLSILLLALILVCVPVLSAAVGKNEVETVLNFDAKIQAG